MILMAVSRSIASLCSMSQSMSSLATKQLGYVRRWCRRSLITFPSWSRSLPESKRVTGSQLAHQLALLVSHQHREPPPPPHQLGPGFPPCDRPPAWSTDRLLRRPAKVTASASAIGFCSTNRHVWLVLRPFACF